MLISCPNTSNVLKEIYVFKTSITAEPTVPRAFKLFFFTLTLYSTCRINYPKHNSHLLFRIFQKKKVVQRNLADDKRNRILKNRGIVVFIGSYQVSPADAQLSLILKKSGV